jgi:hypothetical protein
VNLFYTLCDAAFYWNLVDGQEYGFIQQCINKKSLVDGLLTPVGEVEESFVCANS